MRRVYFLLLFVIALTSTTVAQPAVMITADNQSDTPGAVGPHARVNFNINIFVPASKKDQALKMQEQVRRRIYDLAGHECAVLRDVIASDCKLQSINVSAQRAASLGEEKLEVEGFQINGNITFRIVPKQ